MQNTLKIRIFQNLGRCDCTDEERFCKNMVIFTIGAPPQKSQLAHTASVYSSSRAESSFSTSHYSSSRAESSFSTSHLLASKTRTSPTDACCHASQLCKEDWLTPVLSNLQSKVGLPGYKTKSILVSPEANMDCRPVRRNHFARSRSKAEMPFGMPHLKLNASSLENSRDTADGTRRKTPTET